MVLGIKDRSKKLVKYGFIKDSAKDKYEYDETKGYYVRKEGDPENYDPSHADEERHEESPVLPGFFGPNVEYVKTGYPDTPKKYRLIYKSPSASLEESYYWILDSFRRDLGFPHFKKITDIFSASEQSSMWGQAQQRLGLQQDRAREYMATIGKMTKDLFQLVRELRIIEERLELYQKAPKSHSADVSLKGLYIDMVEGGAKNPSSVYGIAQQVGFTSLPDLFFNTHIHDKSKVDEKVDNMKYNTQVKNVLKRKLYSFLNWKERTHDELKSRFKFTLRYLRQHWGTIKMYMNWVKPYMKNVQRMRMSEEHMEDEEIISSFETSITEVEVLAMQPKKKGIHPCVLISMRYTTQPEMNYSQEQYQHRGPLHIGQVEFHLRAYGWTEHDIEMFQKLKRDEDMELIKIIDDSVAAAMDALGDDLYKYLDKADEKLEKYGIEWGEEEEEERPEGGFGDVAKPFTSIFGGFKELFGAFGVQKMFESKSEGTNRPSLSTKKDIAHDVFAPMWITYKNYKKSHGMLAW